LRAQDCRTRPAVQQSPRGRTPTSRDPRARTSLGHQAVARRQRSYSINRDRVTMAR